MCRVTVRKDNTQLELSLSRDVKGNLISYKYIGDKRKTKENMGLLFNGAGSMVTKDVEKAEVLNVTFVLVFTRKTSVQECQNLGKGWSKGH